MHDKDAVIDGLSALVTSSRPGPEMVERGRAFLRAQLMADPDAYLAALDRLAEPLRDVVAGARMADPDDRLQAVRFTLALHALESAILAGTLDEDAVDNTLYMRYARLEESLEAALPPKPGFTGLSGRHPGGGGSGGPLMPS